MPNPDFNVDPDLDLERNWWNWWFKVGLVTKAGLVAKAELVVQSEMSATDTLRHGDV